MSFVRSAAAALALLGSAACASVGAPSASGAVAPEAATTVTVTNDNLRDVVVYAVRSGMRFRLGPVPSLDVRTFSIPESAIAAAGGVRLMVDPVGTSPPHASETISVTAGAAIDFRVKKRIRDSYYAVRPG